MTGGIEMPHFLAGQKQLDSVALGIWSGKGDLNAFRDFQVRVTGSLTRRRGVMKMADRKRCLCCIEIGELIGDLAGE
jgi:hypothetical protein